MGNLCGKQSDDPFAQPGRTLGSAPPPSSNPTSSVPRKVGGPPRTLGGSSSGTASSGTGDTAEEARKKAAAAAEARARGTTAKPKGKLGSQLEEQKKQTRNDTLKEASNDERRTRDADAAAEARAYN
ncbi:hypothetical protein F5884DRAFT_900528 [Xylogone sp. PMI_703]|nr:hypothetical protein F5884DRAFT_900528 [Xylogone sp. PMI_703]